jgi:hypothetical protein
VRLRVREKLRDYVTWKLVLDFVKSTR